MIRVAGITLLSVFLFSSCMKEKATPDYKGFPKEVGEIFTTQCATTGCHNEVSKDAASGLSLASWEALFKGGRNGADVIPYRDEFSLVSFYVNTYEDLGITLSPSMPFNKPALSREQVQTIKDWINAGAPNSDGDVMFADKGSTRKKFYVTNQGCDVVTVFDQETMVQMRMVDVGNSGAIESPHSIKVSPDGQYWYVIFTAGNALQKFRVSDDAYVGEVPIGPGNWNTFALTSDGKNAYCVDWSGDGKVFYVDLENLTVVRKYQGSGLFIFPHASWLSKDDQTLYVSAQTGNFIYKLDVSDPLSPEIEEISLEPGMPPSVISKYDVHEIILSPDESKYYATCQKSNEVRVMNAYTDEFIKSIPMGTFPQEFSFSYSTDYLFVSCPEDTITFPGKRGSVAVIDYKTDELVKIIYTGHQPHGIGVDDDKGLLYVANRNILSDGPAPHHVDDCGGRNGYMSFVNLNTLELQSQKIEVSVDPYFIGVRNWINH